MSNSKVPQKEILKEWALNECEFFHDSEGKAWARITINNHKEVHQLNSQTFKNFLSKLGLDKMRVCVSDSTIRTVINGLTANAVFYCPEKKVYVRLAEINGSIFYDLADESWRVVEISANGWHILDESPVMFRRYSHMLPQVIPKQGGDPKLLFKYLNLKTEEDKDLYFINVGTSFFPDIPYSIEIIKGVHGSTKSCTQRIKKTLIDPSITPLLTIPKEVKDIMREASHHYILVYDNVDSLSAEISDCLCKISTGIGTSARSLYTNDDDFITCVKRPVSLNGINICSYRPDLLDRSMLIETAPMSNDKRKTESEFWDEFNKDKSKILGGFFDALVKALKIKSSLKIENLPRMADYAKVGESISQALGYPNGMFLEIYNHNIQRQTEEVIYGNAICQVLLEIFEGGQKIENMPMANILAMLNEYATFAGVNTKDKYWPTEPSWLGRKLQSLKPNLEKIGFKIIEKQTSDTHRKVYTIIGPKKIDSEKPLLKGWEGIPKKIGDSA